MSLTIIYPYRNRELERIKISLNSLITQSNTNFKVLFIDYGSTLLHSKEIQEALIDYSFVNYFYSYSLDQPWSRAKAVNIGIKNTTTNYVFIADIDMIFKPNFVEVLYELQQPNTSYYFKVGFLSESESNITKEFNQYNIAHFSGIGAQGLSLFETSELKKVRGFDEFLHFWGAEDEDIHNRLIAAGNKEIFYEAEILMLHRWHPTYRTLEHNNLDKNLQIKSITSLNQQHLLYNKNSSCSVVNSQNWGNSITKDSYNELINNISKTTLINKREIIDHFLYVELPNFENGILNIKIIEDDFKSSVKYLAKKALNKKVPRYYSLKKINDMVLLHLISFYRDTIYSYKITDDLKSIELTIKK